MASKPRNVLYWFRTDLRLHDSPALNRALSLNPTHFYPVWCWDPHYVYATHVGPNRWQFLLDSMSSVSSSLTALNSSSQLFVLRGPPTTVLPALFSEWKITHIVWEKDDDPYTKSRDATIQKVAEEAGVEVLIETGHTLFDADKLVGKFQGSPPKTYGPFVKVIEKIYINDPLAAPASIPSPGTTNLSNWSRASHPVDDYRAPGVDVNYHNREGKDTVYDTFSGPDGKFSVPTMEELGMKSATGPHRGGEERALEIMEEWLEDKKRVLEFAKPETNPSAWDPASTTQLSPHLKFGTLSCRLFHNRLKSIISKSPSATQPPVSLLGQLYWREFFHFQQAVTPNYGQIRGNPVCMNLDWRLANVYKDGERVKRGEEGWENSDPEAWEWLTRWREGRTGFPWIDAIMRQLKQEGWIHHLARHSVACFLTRGHLYISWERGAELFDDFLVDWDPALNSGNWMWLSASAYFSQYFRVYSPIAFGKKWDKNGDYVRKYCPELKDFPEKYIYSPWEAPAAVQKKASCIVGTDYPSPMVDEKSAKTRCLERMKQGYGAKLHGTDEAVLDGTANTVGWWEVTGADKGEEKGKAKRKKDDLEKVGKDGKKQKKLDFGSASTSRTVKGKGRAK